MRNKLKKALNLARKSNGAIIFFDSVEPNDSFAILDLETYEKILDSELKGHREKEEVLRENKEISLTGQNLGDKINQELADLKNQDSFITNEEEKSWPGKWDIPPHIKMKADDQEEGEFREF